ncbi:MAG: tetratricopeptide repeat protein [Defluviimonas sp.]|nr:tetratricopeptide repeat protein [Paracoccaceae bacterium]MCC0064126.1 tetratricopeptide repeat protein [Defluviimonas sp.]
MSESDSFIDEVTEEVRRDKLFAVFRKYAWIGVLAVAAIVGGTAWIEWRKASAETAARAFGDAVIGALAADGPAARVAALDAITRDGGTDDHAKAAIVGLLAADEALRAGDRDGALQRLEEIAADATLPANLGQLARLKYVILAGDGMTPADRDAALAELATAGAPYRPLAVEQQAVALMADGDGEGALKLFQGLLVDADASAELRRRVQQMIVVLGGTPDAA